MKHHATRDFWRLYDALPNRIKTLADQNFDKLKSDPYHPSLHFKQVGDFWSARVGMGWRALAVRDDDQFACFWIGSHADYNKLLKR